jgi:branched-chain amino acid transport system permease protein
VALGLILFFVVFDPVRHKKELLGPAIGSQAFGLILASVASYLAGGYSLQFPTMLRLPEIQVGSMRISSLQVGIAVCALVAMLAFDALVRHSRFGRSVRAIAENEDAARLLGINVRRESAVAFALSSGMAGLAAMLYSLRYGVVDPFFGFQIGLTGLVVMVLGGVGNVRGAMIGGVALGMIQMLATGLLWSGAQQVVPWIMLVIVLVFFPHGILGGRGIEEKV